MIMWRKFGVLVKLVPKKIKENDSYLIFSQDAMPKRALVTMSDISDCYFYYFSKIDIKISLIGALY